MSRPTQIVLGQDNAFREMMEREIPAIAGGASVIGTPHIAYVLRIARHVWSCLEEDMPAAMRVFAPQVIPLYILPRAADAPPTGATHFRMPRVSLGSKPLLPEMRGILVSLHPDDLQQSSPLRSLLLHEFLHFLLHPAFAATPALEESLVERLVREWPFPAGLDNELHALPWRFDGFQSTCGFRNDDFATIERSDAFSTAWIACTLAELHNLSSADAWSFCLTVHHLARRNGTPPSFPQILQAAAVTSSQLVDDIVSGVAGRPMREGAQSFFLPFGNGRAFIVVVDVVGNPRYGNLGEDNSRDNRQFTVRSREEHLRLEIRDADGVIDTQLFVRGDFLLDLRELFNTLERRGTPVSYPESASLRTILSGMPIELHASSKT